MSQAARRKRSPSYAELRAVVEFAPDAIFIADAEGRYTYVNDAACRLLGWSASELLGKTIKDLIPEEDVPRLLASRARILAGRTEIGEWLLRRKDGSWTPVEVHANALPNGQWQGFVREVSARKARDAERDALLADSESQRRWLETVMETLPLGVLLFRPERRPSEEAPIEQTRIAPLAAGGGAASVRHDERSVGGRALHRAADPVGLHAAVREGELLLQAIFDLLPVGVWIADATGRLVKTNPAGRRIWEGARYLPISEFGQYKGWWADTGKPIAAEEWGMARALQKGETSLGELIRIQCFDGSFKTIIHSAAPLRDARGEIVGGIVVNQDITELHEAQEKQRTSERLMRTIFDLLPVGLWVADGSGKIELANPAGVRIWSGTRYVGPEEFGEYKAWWLETGKPVAPDEWGLTRAIRYGETSRSQLMRIQSFDGSYKTVINWAAPIRGDGGEIIGAIAVNEDVTSLHQTQEQLRAAVGEREEILARVAHDLRNPLHGIMLSAGVLEVTTAALSDGAGARELAASILDTARGMSGLVDDLFAVSVAGAAGRSMLKLQPIAAAELLARAAKFSEPMLRENGLRLVVKSDSRLPVVNVDVERVLRVFANLLDNARKHTPQAELVTIAAEETAGGIVFSVANGGDALQPDQLHSMFQPFWQAEQDRRGAGLGLSICRYIVEEHGGSIWAEAAAGQRVRVVFVLPRLARSAGLRARRSMLQPPRRRTMPAGR